MKNKKEIKFWNATIEKIDKLSKPVVGKSCPCCNGTGKCEGQHYDDIQPCLTCGGSGHF